MATVYRIERCPHCNKNIRQRSAEQNNKLHAALQDVANQLNWPRDSQHKLDVETWKRLFTAAWWRSEGKSAEMYPAIDEQGFDVITRHTSRMSKEDLSSLLEYIISMGTEWGVIWSDETRAA